MHKPTITLLVAALVAAAVAAPRAAADAGDPVDAVAARICSGIFVRIGFEAFTSRFGTPDACASHLAAAAAAAVTECAGAADSDGCLQERVRASVEEYVDGEATSGGTYTTESGARVHVVSVDGGGVDDAERRAWAVYLARLVHGDELGSVTLRLGSAAHVQTACGPSALACYLPSTQTIVAAPVDRDAAPSAKSLVAHEYGHHVANNRTNAPWPALDRGTKRWSTHMRICARVRSRELTTLALWGPGYRFLPAEGFAEAYRVLAQRRLALAEAPWMLVDDVFHPDLEALRLLEQDVLDPWLGPTTVTLSGRGNRSFRVATPLDGTVRVTVASTPGTDYRVSAPKIVCGRRSIDVRVRRVRGNGAFRLSVSRP